VILKILSDGRVDENRNTERLRAGVRAAQLEFSRGGGGGIEDACSWRT
jgi:hypothetical protein